MIDAHMHFWRLDRGDYGWLTPDLSPLYRDFMPEHALPLIQAAGIDRVIAVQGAETEAETLFLLECAGAHDWIAGVVGWTDLAAPDAPASIAALVAAGGGKLRGLRPMLQDMLVRDWIADPALDPAIDAMIAHGLVFDALVRVDQLDALRRRAERSPDLRIAIDHAAKPDIAGGGHAAWAAAIAPLAALPQVHCKISGLLTERGDQPATAIAPYVATLETAFGAERLIWGSDHPVLTLAGDYAGWLSQARTLLPHAAVYGDNAARFYGIGTAPVLRLSPQDNVGVALRDLTAGAALLDGVQATAPVAFGFKVALVPIAAGEAVLKYGVSIGSATRDITPGEPVHLHNMRSDYTATHTREAKDQEA